MPKFLFNLIVFLTTPLVISGADFEEAPHGLFLANYLFDCHFSYDKMIEYLNESPYFTIIEEKKSDITNTIYVNYLTASTEKYTGQDWLLKGWEKVLKHSFPNRFYTQLIYKGGTLDWIRIIFMDNWGGAKRLRKQSY